MYIYAVQNAQTKSQVLARYRKYVLDYTVKCVKNVKCGYFHAL